MRGNLSIRSRQVVLPEGPRPATLVIRDGLIAAIDLFDSSSDAIDVGEWWILPGLVDTHVHVNEPGRTDWEGFATATLAAAAGGVTTLVDMPLNSVPATTTAAALEEKRSAGQGKCAVDVAFWGGVVPGNTADLEPLARAGVRGFKCFMVPSGVDEFPGVVEADLEQAMPLISRLDLPLLVHAELPGPIAAVAETTADPRRYDTWLASRPPAAEVEAIQVMIRLAERHGCQVHIVHVATGEAIADLRSARARGVRVTAETCPHYLCFAAEEIQDGATEFKCAPPIRSRSEQAALWQALAGGTLDLIASDHSPCPAKLKRKDVGDFMSAWGGIPSLEIGLSAVWTASNPRGLDSSDVARWMSQNPARLAGLTAHKGAIAIGRDADLVVFDPEAEWTVEPDRLQQRHKLTPYAGRKLQGRVVDVYLRGERIVANGAPTGEILGRVDGASTGATPAPRTPAAG
jgi:allantoinase